MPSKRGEQHKPDRVSLSRCLAVTIKGNRCSQKATIKRYCLNHFWARFMGDSHMRAIEKVKESL